MSEERTKDLGKKYDTKPTIETILNRMIQMEERLSTEFNGRIDGLSKDFNGRFDTLSKEVNVLGERFDAMGIRMDRLEGEVHEVKTLFFNMRADIKEISVSVKQHFKETA